MDAFWIVLTGSLVAGSGAILGCFLVLRRMAMLGDAISHAILPGIVLAFLISHSRAPFIMFLGAAAIGIITTWLVQFLSSGGVHRDAALGVTFTSLFALGVVGVSIFGTSFDLDVDCVLYGEIAYTPFDIILSGERSFGPRPVWINAGLFIFNLITISFFFKEFKLCAFDPMMAAAVGIPVTVMHYLLMSLVALTTVGAFESVGVILVVAMLIVPAATAYLLTERLHHMIFLAILIGIASSSTGYYLAGWLDCSIAGAMGLMAGVFFALAFFFSPTHGIVSRWLRQRALRYRVAEEDVMMWVGRQAERLAPADFSVAELSRSQRWVVSKSMATLQRLLKRGLLTVSHDVFTPTETGQQEARRLLKRHRLYETYLDELGYQTDHIHAPADRVEHHIPPVVTEQLAEATGHPETDPHGKQIPR